MPRKWATRSAPVNRGKSGAAVGRADRAAHAGDRDAAGHDARANIIGCAVYLHISAGTTGANGYWYEL